MNEMSLQVQTGASPVHCPASLQVRAFFPSRRNPRSHLYTTLDPMRKEVELLSRSVARSKVTARSLSELLMLSTAPSGRSGMEQRISRQCGGIPDHLPSSVQRRMSLLPSADSSWKCWLQL